MSASPEVLTLRSPRTIRTRCRSVLEAGLAGTLAHFEVRPERLEHVAELTVQVTRRRYPDLAIPAHSRFAHFDAGSVRRLARLEQQIAHFPARERARMLTDVVVTSVLLDAGAGPTWSYHERATGLTLGRSEGLAIASLEWAASGGLSSRGQAYEVDATGLSAVSEDSLGRAFQVRADNPLVGVAGRVHLLRGLGAVLRERSDVFGADGRLGALVDHLWTRSHHEELRAAAILDAVLDALGSIWPGRLSLDGCSLGDVWKHPAAGGEGKTNGFLPLHKLSQWLSYSLLHPLAVSGLAVRDLHELTGLAEYRNGGLFVDAGVLVPRHAQVCSVAHEVSAEVIVEWRALTVALLDLLAPLVREKLGLSEEQLPLAAVLEGGTWAAGRELAQSLRADGSPPIRVASDGTVF